MIKATHCITRPTPGIVCSERFSWQLLSDLWYGTTLLTWTNMSFYKFSLALVLGLSNLNYETICHMWPSLYLPLNGRLKQVWLYYMCIVRMFQCGIIFWKQNKVARASRVAIVGADWIAANREVISWLHKKLPNYCPEHVEKIWETVVRGQRHTVHETYPILLNWETLCSQESIDAIRRRRITDTV